MGLNRCSFIGHLGRDVELKYTASGQAVATLSLGVSEVWKDKTGQKQEKTEWVRVVLWDKPAESLAEYLTKGKQIYVDGRMQTREWEKDGVKRYTTEIRGDKIVLLGGGAGRPSASGPDPTSASNDDTAGMPADDDIPF